MATLEAILSSEFLELLQDGCSPLVFASLNGHANVVEKLLQHGATVDLQDKVCVISKFILHDDIYMY